MGREDRLRYQVGVPVHVEVAHDQRNRPIGVAGGHGAGCGVQCLLPDHRPIQSGAIDRAKFYQVQRRILVFLCRGGHFLCNGN